MRAPCRDLGSSEAWTGISPRPSDRHDKPVREPLEVLLAIAARLRPGGRVVIVTDNAASWSFRLFNRRHLGGYHFPRHWQLFSPSTLPAWPGAGLEVERQGTMVSPVNWVYSIHNALVDWGAPNWLVQRFTLASPLSLGVFTVLGAMQQALGRAELLCVVLRRPANGEPGQTAAGEKTGAVVSPAVPAISATT